MNQQMNNNINAMNSNLNGRLDSLEDSVEQISPLLDNAVMT